MKKLLLLIAVLILNFACKEEEIQSYDKLTPDEQAAIKQMGNTQCLAKVTPSYERFKRISAEVFTSTGYNQGRGFEYQFKNGTTIKRTVNFYVWKRTPTEIYFYVNDDVVGTDYFLRFTKAENDQMIDDLKEAHCLRPEIYISSINSSTLTMTDNYVLPKNVQKEEYDDTYTMNFSYLAFFANYNISRSLKLFDVDGNQVGNTTSFTSTLTAKNFTIPAYSYQSPDYTQNFCSITRPASGHRFPNERNVEGFKITNCSTTLPAGWNLAAPFTP